MTVEEFIYTKLHKLEEQISVNETSGVQAEEAIYAKLMSKKFRKLKAGQLCVDNTRRAVKRAVENQTPILISVCFGGNKLWRLDEAPEVDWAELFSLLYYLDWAKTVASVHAPGATLDFYSQDICVENIDNITAEELDTYSRTFKDIIAWVEPFLPNNITISYRRNRDKYNTMDNFYADLDVAKEEFLAKNNGKVPPLSDIQRAKIDMNVRLNPGQAEDPGWQEKVELEHQSYFMTKTQLEYFDDPDMVLACPTYYDDSIVVGSTKYSIAKFWVGVGALEKNGDSYHDLVLTPKQLEAAKFDWQKVDITGLTGKNFSKIRVLI